MALDLKKRYRTGLPGEAASPGSLLSVASRLVFLDTSVNLLSWNAAADWTDVDISAYVGDDTPRGAIIMAELYFYAGDVNAKFIGWFRKNGSGITAYLPRIINHITHAQAGGAQVGYNVNSQLFVPVDENKIFETKLEETLVGTESDLSFIIDLVGYFV